MLIFINSICGGTVPLRVTHEDAVIDVKNMYENVEGYPSSSVRFTLNGKQLENDFSLLHYNICDENVIHASLYIFGGKGGFGAMLRSMAKQAGAKKTTDFGACRDLSGRRLRHVNDEKLLQKWRETKDAGQEFDAEMTTESGIDLWFLSTPSWSDGFGNTSKKRYLKPRRKTKLCNDWVKARESRPPPDGAPIWWGCARGRRCEFAHGEKELRGEAADKLRQSKIDDARAIESSKRKSYLDAVVNNGDDGHEKLNEIVTMGLRAAKKSRTVAANADDLSTSDAAGRATESVLPVHIDQLSSFVTTVDQPILTSLQTAAPVAPQQNTPSPAAHAVHFSPATEPASDSTGLVNARPGSTSLAFRTVSGVVDVTDDGELESRSDFGTVTVECGLCSGRWYYEAELVTGGLAQIGWASRELIASLEGTDGNGVGDDPHSWAYDGSRRLKWHENNEEYGREIVDVNSSKVVGSVDGPWQAGDVVGCILEITGPQNFSIAFTLNGRFLGTAFRESLVLSSEGPKAGGGVRSPEREGSGSGLVLFPALSLEEGEVVLVNVGQHGFRYPFVGPTGSSSSSTDSTGSGSGGNYLAVLEGLAGGARSALVASAAKLDQYEIPPVGSVKAGEEELALAAAADEIFDEIDLAADTFSDIDGLRSLGLKRLKFELQLRGLKTGGALEERAQRLFSVRGKDRSTWPRSILRPPSAN